MKLKRLLFPLLTLLLVLLLIPRAQAEEVATSAKACIIIDEASGRVLLRPSGTEPLLKLYLTLRSDSREAGEKEMEKLREAAAGEVNA